MTETVVIYRLGTLGDTVVALPCFHLIARAFPNAERLLLTNEVDSGTIAAPLSVLGTSGLIHGSLGYPIGLRDPKRLFRLARKLRSTAARTVIYLNGSRGIRGTLRDVAFFRLAGFSRIIGAPVNRDLAFNWIDPNTGIAEQESLRLGRAMRELGTIDFDDPSAWDLHITAQEREAAAPFVAAAQHAPIIAINHGGKVAKNDWGEERWRSFLSLLGRQFGTHALAIVGSQADRDRADRLTEHWPGVTLNLCGRLTPRESAAFLMSVHLFIGHDSGPLHLASACQTPTIGLFGNNKPAAVWHPYGAHNVVIRAEAGMEAIAPEWVYNAARVRLDRNVRHKHHRSI